ncbi:hypothetical protein JCM10049v2_007517 [Rhodotorula toruloides]
MAYSSEDSSDGVAQSELSWSVEAVALSMQLDFGTNWYSDPWAYSRAQAAWVEAENSLDSEALWEASSHLTYAGIDLTDKGIRVQKRSAVTGCYDVELESVHLVDARRYTRTAMGKKGVARSVDDFAGQATVDWFIAAGVVPDCADINCDSNRILLERRFRTALDNRHLRLVPNADLVLVRLVSEIKYQERRLSPAPLVPQKRGSPDDSSAATPPIRPRFDEFYDELEKTGAVFRLFGTIELEDPIIVRTMRKAESFKVEGINLDSARRATIASRAETADVPDSEYAVFPPLRVPVSINCLIYAVKDTVEIGSPASYDVYDETRRLQGIIQLLVFYWMLDDDSTEADIRRLLDQFRQRVLSDYPGTFWANNIHDLGSFTYADLASHVSLPENAIDTRTARPPRRPGRRRAPGQARDSPVQPMSGVETEVMNLGAVTLRQHDTTLLPHTHDDSAGSL